MKKIRVLHIGIKNWPFDYAFSNSEVIGIRGGGVNKYCDMFIGTLPENIETYIITQHLKGQRAKDIYGNVTVFRLFTFGGRAIRQLIANFLSFFYSLYLIPRYKIDIIHGHMQPGIFVGYFLCKLFRKKSIGTPYSFKTVKSGKMNGPARWVEESFYKKIDLLVFETEENRDKAKELRNLTFINSIVIHTGIAIPAIIYPLETDAKINIFYIGRQVKVKALDHLIMAAKELDQDIRDRIHIDIIGEGELLQSHRNLVISNKLTDSISIHGFLENVKPFFEKSTIFILPSFMEGFSISLLEAMSYGKVCMVNNFGVPFTTKEVYIMENNSPSTIASSITKLVNDSDLMNELSKNARARIERDFSIFSFANNYARAYNSLLNV
ncbi:MAG TPA: hypothetical protein DIC42_05630 [Holosporales bacterium]|nr:hypothetical protein [Holosporales bacterium]